MVRGYTILLFLLLLPASSFAGNTFKPLSTINIGQFSQAPLSDITPKGWQAFLFPKVENITAYFLMKDQNITVVKAVSHNGASGYYRKLNLNPKTYPLLRWNWKIENTIKSADILTKEGDDYPARIYISFDYDTGRLEGFEWLKYKLYSVFYDEPLPLAVINYVWANKVPIGTVVDNAYTKRVKMIVVESGIRNLRQWMNIERNIYDDYLKAFEEEPGDITGIAIMTDTDNTGESAISYYGDIQLLKLLNNRI